MIFENIKKLCVERGVSIHRVEQECNLGNATIRGWESRCMPRVGTLQKVADYFGVTLDELTRESEDSMT